MSSLTSSADRGAQPPVSFRLKAGLFPLTLLEIQQRHRTQFEHDLREKVAEAPAFFQQTPVILSIDPDGEGEMSIADMAELCRQYGLIPVALRGGSVALQGEALDAGLALMPETKSKAGRAAKAEELSTQESGVVEAAETAALPVSDPVELPVAEAAEPLTVAVAKPSKVITTPIRSGQQVYAPGADLIILSSVSAGAEVLADGHIHIYGPLRGRALAGVRGDTSARIFCQSLEAELVSIAGDFKLSDDLRGPFWKKAVQISHDEKTLAISELV